MKRDILAAIPESDVLYRELLQCYALHPMGRTALVADYTDRLYMADRDAALESLIASCARIDLQLPPHAHVLVEDYIAAGGYAADVARWLLAAQHDDHT